MTTNTNDMKYKYLILIVALLLIPAASVAQNAKQVARELVRQGVPHAQIVLAQARLETGNFQSDRCKRDHNLFGIKHKGRYARYDSWQDCVADYKACISSRYKGGCYYKFLERIGYASDTRYPDKVRRIVETSK